MDKTILQEYIDACELIKETEQDIKRLNQKKKTVVQDKVKGSMHDFPYAARHFKVQSTSYTCQDDDKLWREEKLLAKRKENAEKIKLQVEEWMLTIPARMQRIVRYRYLEGMSWQQVAAKMGQKATADSVRMELNLFLK